jgi:Flp pilus assembly CpaE family ATPase
MAAAALAARIPLAARRAQDHACGLAFDELGGPLVAVCALAGGAGASTLALQLARQAAVESAAPVLLAEADPMHAGLATLAGCASPRPLTALASDLADERVPESTFLELAPRLRLIAATPQSPSPVEPGALAALLAQARDAHGLVIVDCATHWTPTSPPVGNATHIIWAVPATPAGLARAQQQLQAADTTPPAGRAREVLVATAVAGQQPTVRVRALRKLARDRCERLVLIPYDNAAAQGTLATAPLRALTALAPTLRNRP